MEPESDLFKLKLNLEMFIFRTKNLEIISWIGNEDFFL